MFACHAEYSTTESDEFEKQDGGDLTCEDESTFFDAADYFIEPNDRSSAILSSTSCGEGLLDIQMEDSSHLLPQIKRRSKLPEPTEKERGISLWSIIKDSVGKDLTRVCLPVYFNEPLSSLQKGFEDLEYSHLLDQAYQYGKMVRSFYICGSVFLRFQDICLFYDESIEIIYNNIRLQLNVNP